VTTTGAPKGSPAGLLSAFSGFSWACSAPVSGGELDAEGALLVAGTVVAAPVEPPATVSGALVVVVAGWLEVGGLWSAPGLLGELDAAAKLGASVLGAAATWSARTRVTCTDWEAPRNLLGLLKRLLTRTGAATELGSRLVAVVVWSPVAELAAAAAASELMAEARMPNWPVRVTTTKRGFEERVGLAAGAAAAGLGCGPATAEAEFASAASDAPADDVRCSCGRASRDRPMATRPRTAWPAGAEPAERVSLATIWLCKVGPPTGDAKLATACCCC